MSRGARALAVLGVAAIAVGGIWWWARGRPLPPPRNVLLLTIDTLRVDRVGAYGSTRGATPRIDALAAEGIRFDKAYAPVPLTGPSHASMLTGRYPISHGLRNNGSEILSEEEVLVPEILRERGFRTAAIVSALVLSSSFGLDQGFDLYYEKDISGSEKGRGLWYDQRPADKTIDRAVSWLKAEADRPFFLWVHLFDPHDPYDPPAPFKERFAGAPYDGEVAFADEQAGRLFDEMKRLGVYDDTLIVMAADHGEGLGEHGERYHAIFVYDTTMHVPLILRLPGGRGAGRVVRDLASTMDIAPTILDALGVEPAAPMDGVSLVSAAARAGRIPARSLFLESIYPSASYGWSAVRALVTPSWKLIEVPDRELYDVGRDRAETENLYVRESARAAGLTAEYTRAFADLQDAARETESATIDDETRDRLMSLGYIAGQQSESRTGDAPDPKRMVFLLGPLNRASAHLKVREYAEAETIYRKALEADPDNKIALLQLARALVMQRKFDAAVPLFERAVATYPDGEEFYRVYGWSMLAAERPKEAAAIFRRALDQLPESGHMHFLLGYVRFLGEDFEGAAEELDLAIRLGRGFGKPHYLLAICRLQRGDEAGALASLQEYLRLDPDVESLFRDPYFERMRERPEFQDLIKRYL